MIQAFQFLLYVVGWGLAGVVTGWLIGMALGGLQAQRAGENTSAVQRLASSLGLLAGIGFGVYVAATTLSVI